MAEESDPASTPASPESLSYAGPKLTGKNRPYLGTPPDANAKTWGMLVHLSALVQLLGIPSIVGPLVIWLIKKNEMPFVDDQGKEAVNFQITCLIVAICLLPTICIVVGIFLLVALGLAMLILSIIAAIKANEGVAYRYPLTWRLIK